ncbi:MAG: ATP-binding protein [Spirochaetes bacterium]|nr:ATP-binding protein [Spirochaetota bacterium]
MGLEWEKVFQIIGQPIMILDDSQTILDVNHAITHLIGLPKDSIIGKKCYDIFHNGNPTQPCCPFIELISKNKIEPVEMELQALNKIFLVTCTPLIAEDGSIDKIIHASVDITERKKNEELLLRLSSIVEHTVDLISTATPDGHISYLNRAGYELIQIPLDYNIQLLTIKDFHPAWAYKIIIEEGLPTAKEKGVWFGETALKRFDGIEIPVSQVIMAHRSFTGDLTYFSTIMRDISYIRRIDEMMLQNEKMMTVGSLAAGMAHEINNPLGVILQGVQAITMKLSPDFDINRKLAEEIGIDLHALNTYLEKSDISSYLNGIRDAGLRAADIVSGMLQFSRRSSGEKRFVDVNLLIERSIDLVSKDYDLKKKYDFKNIEIVKKYDPSLTEIYCIQNEIEQVILNLLKNAAQALNEVRQEGFKPRIEIVTKRDESEAIIEIIDNGPGIDEYSKRHIFEPFYTTKSPGEGTGLGLAVAFFIVHKNHGGSIEVESEINRGTRMIIRLPLGGEQYE